MDSYMTNNEIVEIVYREYNLHKLIVDMINNSSLDKSCDDLEQYIYLLLLEMSNKKLNLLYENNWLKQFISQIIKNQRNLSKYSEYGKYKISESIEVGDTGEFDKWKDDHNIKNNLVRLVDGRLKIEISDEDIESHDYIKDIKIHFMYSELDRYNNKDNLTEYEIRIARCYDLYRMKLNRRYTLTQLANHFHCSRSKVATIIRFAKEKIKERYVIYFTNGLYYDSYEQLLGDSDL